MTDLVRSAAARDPDGPALGNGRGVRYTWSELDRLVGRTAAELADRGATPGDTIVWIAEPTEQQVVWMHAAWRLGCTVAPLHPHSSASDIALALTTMAPRLVLHDETTEALVPLVPDPPGEDGESIASSWRAVPVSGLIAQVGGRGSSAGSSEGASGASVEASPGSIPAPKEHPGPPGAAAAVIWTSGTSGRSRGVVIPWRALLFNAHATRERLGLRSDDRWYASLSLAHVGGLALVTRAAVLGSSVVLSGAFSESDFRDFAISGAITHASLVPVMLRRILDADDGQPAAAGLRAILIGGAAAPPALVERAHAAGYPVAPTYGMSEACSQIATATPVESRAAPDSVGRPLDGVDVRIGDGGEILVRGDLLATGYLGSEQPLLDADGWLHTGDMGEVDAAGRLRIRGRRTDRIISGGLNIDPLEVEAALRAVPWITDAVAVGVSDAEWGERLVALVVTGTARIPGQNVVTDLDGLLSSLRREKRPKACYVVESIPRNRMGKHDRAEARVQAAELVGG